MFKSSSFSTGTDALRSESTPGSNYTLELTSDNPTNTQVVSPRLGGKLAYSVSSTRDNSHPSGLIETLSVFDSRGDQIAKLIIGPGESLRGGASDGNITWFRKHVQGGLEDGFGTQSHGLTEPVSKWLKKKFMSSAVRFEVEGKQYQWDQNGPLQQLQLTLIRDGSESTNERIAWFERQNKYTQQPARSRLIFTPRAEDLALASIYTSQSLSDETSNLFGMTQEGSVAPAQVDPAPRGSWEENIVLSFLICEKARRGKDYYVEHEASYRYAYGA